MCKGIPANPYDSSRFQFSSPLYVFHGSKDPITTNWQYQHFINSRANTAKLESTVLFTGGHGVLSNFFGQEKCSKPLFDAMLSGSPIAKIIADNKTCGEDSLNLFFFNDTDLTSGRFDTYMKKL